MRDRLSVSCVKRKSPWSLEYSPYFRYSRDMNGLTPGMGIAAVIKGIRGFPLSLWFWPGWNFAVMARHATFLRQLTVDRLDRPRNGVERGSRSGDWTPPPLTCSPDVFHRWFGAPAPGLAARLFSIVGSGRRRLDCSPDVFHRWLGAPAAGLAGRLFSIVDSGAHMSGLRHRRFPS